jgi:hypothetical protein
MIRLLGRVFAILVFTMIATSCALLGGSDDQEMKSKDFKFSSPASPYKKVSISSADYVYQSEKTGSTIAINSLCQKYSDVKLDNLKSNILVGVDNLKVDQERTVTFNDREGKRTIAYGSTDGVRIRVDILIFKKNNCTFDLAFISRPDLYMTEAKIFEDFLVGFKVP